MTPITRKFFPLFSFMHFIALLIPWPWACDSWIYCQAPRETASRGGPTILDAQTDEVLSVSDDDLEYLTQEEAQQIIERFMEIPRSYDRLVFWTGIPREWVQQWADDHSMLTFSSAMGPLMDSTDDRCLRRIKKRKQWKKYIKGACGIFARYACKRGIVRVLTLPPSWAEFIRPESTYRNIEEPVLKGRSSCCYAVQINTVHLLTTCEELEYQTWPQNHIPEKLRCRGAAISNFRLPRWSRKALKAATKSLRSNCVSSTVSAAPESVNINVVLDSSVRRTSRPQMIEQPKGDKQSRDSTNAQSHSQLQSQQPQSNTRPQTHQTTSKKKQPKTQQSAIIKIEQLQKQQPLSRKQQPQSHQTSNKDKKPQTQQLLSKNKKPQTQQSPSKKKQPQKQQTKTQQPQSKKPQLQNSKQPQQGQQPPVKQQEIDGQSWSIGAEATNTKGRCKMDFRHGVLYSGRLSIL